uniref:SGNH domain-containing protein n=1 Tax=Strigamia maritima TaxID=126957 RepID=T1J0Z6_STRMM
MSDMFSHVDVKNLLTKKKVVIIGDSNMRGMYKDIVCLLNKNELLPESALKAKMEPSFMNDKLVHKSALNNGRDFREERQFHDHLNHTYVDFFFVTRCHDKYFDDKIVKNFRERQPDIVIMNSCLWDVTRWGPNGIDPYKENLRNLMRRLKEVLKDDCLFIWTTTMPISQDMRGGFLIPQVEFLRHQIRFEIMEANLFAWTTITKNGFDVLDLHYYMQMNILRRAKDGIHWLHTAMRHVSNYVLTHIALSWGVKLPGRITSKELTYASRYPLYPEFPAENEEPDTPRENSAPKKRKILRPHHRLGDRR